LTNFSRGSGTYEHNGVIFSSLVGYVAKVNKLVSVRPVKSRYKAKVGDIVVGRVSEVSLKHT
jgi:exosome complex component RRP4